MKQTNLFLGILILVTLFGCQSTSNKITIGYVQITQDPVLDAAKTGFFRALADSGYIPREKISMCLIITHRVICR